MGKVLTFWCEHRCCSELRLCSNDAVRLVLYVSEAHELIMSDFLCKLNWAKIRFAMLIC